MVVGDEKVKWASEKKKEKDKGVLPGRSCASHDGEMHESANKEALFHEPGLTSDYMVVSEEESMYKGIQVTWNQRSGSLRRQLGKGNPAHLPPRMHRTAPTCFHRLHSLSALS